MKYCLLIGKFQFPDLLSQIETLEDIPDNKQYDEDIIHKMRSQVA